MATIILEKFNETYSRISVDDESDITILWNLQEHFTVEIEGAKWSPAVRNHLWNGKKSFFNASTGLIANGLIPMTEKWAEQRDYKIRKIGFYDYPEIDFTKFQEENKEILKGTKYVPRDYQEGACYKALSKKHGILECCTSSGKSLIIYLFIRHLLMTGIDKILLIVPNVMLVKQMYSDFADYGWKEVEEYCETLGGGDKATFDRPVLISTWQSLQKKERDFFTKYTGVIADECHGCKASIVNKILKCCENSIYRLGTTGTLPTAQSDLLNIASVLGQVVYKIQSKELIDRGVLTKMIIANIILKYPKDFIKANKSRTYPEEVKLLEELPARQKALDVIFKHTPLTHNMLILVNHIDHLDTVSTYIEDKFPDRKVEVISGRVNAKKREEIRQSAENDEGLVIVATYATMSTGVNIRKLHDIVLYGTSKSKIKVLQSLGRGLRKHETKNKVILYDVVDDMVYIARTGRRYENYLYQHWRERVGYYTKEKYPMTNLEIAI